MQRLWFIVALGSLAALADTEAADSPKTNAPKTSRRAREVDDMGELTPGREAAALTFAEQHHPELAGLLRRLQKSNRRQYDRALKSIFAARERLARLKTRDRDRYRLELRNWELESRIRLLAVRSSLSDDSELDARLERLLRERVEVHLKILKLGQERLAKRQERIQNNIDRILKDKDAAARRELNRLKRSLGVYGKDKKTRRSKQQPVSTKDRDDKTKKNREGQKTENQ